MIDYYSSDGGSHWLLRVWTPFDRLGPFPLIHRIKWGLRSIFYSFLDAVTGRFPHQRSVEFKTFPKHSGRCWCPFGSTTSLRMLWGGFGFWLSRGRWWGSTPCACELALHEYHVSQGDDCQCVVAELEIEMGE